MLKAETLWLVLTSRDVRCPSVPVFWTVFSSSWYYLPFFLLDSGKTELPTVGRKKKKSGNLCCISGTSVLLPVCHVACHWDRMETVWDLPILHLSRNPVLTITIACALEDISWTQQNLDLPPCSHRYLCHTLLCS